MEMAAPKHITIIGYYNLADGLLAASKFFKEGGYEVSFFPLSIYRTDENDKRENWVDILISFLLGKFHPEKGVVYHSNCIPNIKPRSYGKVLWWYPLHHIVDDMKKIKEGSAHRQHLYFNWDPDYIPIDHEVWNIFRDRKKMFMKYIDKLITTNPLEVTAFTNKAVYCPPGYHKFFHYPGVKGERDFEKDFVCDVSIVCTNLYTDRKLWPKKYQSISRGNLVDELYKEAVKGELKLHIYGPSFLKEMYPKAYKYQISYYLTHKVFFNSKINLSINAISIDGYFSERASLILGSGGIVYTDSQMGFGLIDGLDYIFADKSSPVKQIKELLFTSEGQLTLKKMRKRISLCEIDLTWKNLFNIVDGLT